MRALLFVRPLWCKTARCVTSGAPSSSSSSRSSAECKFSCSKHMVWDPQTPTPKKSLKMI